MLQNSGTCLLLLAGLCSGLKAGSTLVIEGGIKEQLHRLCVVNCSPMPPRQDCAQF